MWCSARGSRAYAAFFRRRIEENTSTPAMRPAIGTIGMCGAQIFQKETGAKCRYFITSKPIRPETELFPKILVSAIFFLHQIDSEK